MALAERWQRLIVFTYQSLLLLFLIGVLVVSASRIGTINPKSNQYADFLSFYRMGQLTLSNDRQQIYNPAVQLQYFNNLKAVLPTNQPVFAQAPPPFFLLMVPFALLPLIVSFRLWIFLSIISVAFAMFFFMRKELNLRTIIFFLVGVCASFPAILGLAIGQTNWFLLALFTMYFWCLTNKKDFGSGLLFAISLCKFQYGPFLLIPMIARKRWRALSYSLAIVLLMLIVSSIVYGSQNVFGYTHMLFGVETTTQQYSVYPEHQISLRGLLGILTDRKTALVLSILIETIILIPLYFAWRHEDSSKTSNNWLICISLLCTLIFSAHTHLYDDIFLALPAACIFKLRASQKWESPGQWYWYVLFSLVLTFPFFSWILIGITMHVDVIKRVPFLICNAAMLIAAIFAAKNSISQNNRSI